LQYSKNWHIANKDKQLEYYSNPKVKERATIN
jgi:hypothetical protein